MPRLCTRSCACQGRECPLGSRGLEQEVLGCGLVVAPREAQAMLMAGAEGWGWTAGKCAAGLGSSKLGASSPALEKSFAFASQLCAQRCGNVNRFAVFPEVLPASRVFMLLPL